MKSKLLERLKDVSRKAFTIRLSNGINCKKFLKVVNEIFSRLKTECHEIRSGQVERIINVLSKNIESALDEKSKALTRFLELKGVLDEDHSMKIIKCEFEDLLNKIKSSINKELSKKPIANEINMKYKQKPHEENNVNDENNVITNIYLKAINNDEEIIEYSKPNIRKKISGEHTTNNTDTNCKNKLEIDVKNHFVNNDEVNLESNLKNILEISINNKIVNQEVQRLEESKLYINDANIKKDNIDTESDECKSLNIE